MRYYLNIVADKGLLKDPEGEEFPDIYAAMVEAEHSARAFMASELTAGRKLLPDWGIQISDGRGVVFDQVTFDELLCRNESPTAAQMAAQAPASIRRARTLLKRARAPAHESQKLRREIRESLANTRAELRTLFRLAAELAKLTD